MSPQVAREFIAHVAGMPSAAPVGAPVAFECECGWETAYGARVAALAALRRHLIRCH